MSHPVHQRPAKHLGRTEELRAGTANVPKEPSSLLSANALLTKEKIALERETAAQPLHLLAE
jgi:hypothetical protein